MIVITPGVMIMKNHNMAGFARVSYSFNPFVRSPAPRSAAWTETEVHFSANYKEVQRIK